MGEMIQAGPGSPRAAIIERLVSEGARIDTAAMYTDAFLEYREATINIEKYGAIVLAPRTQNPIDNPYIKIRDAAIQKFQMRAFRAVRADWLWTP